MHRPLMCIAAGWIVGEGLAAIIPSKLFYWFALIVCVVGGLLYCKYMKALLLWLCLIGVAFGAAYLIWYQEVHTSVFQQPIEGMVVGNIATPAVVDGDQIRFDIYVLKLKTQSGWQQIPDKEIIRLTTKAEQPADIYMVKHWFSGCMLQFPFQLEKPMSARNPGGFDYAAYLKRQQIYWQTRVPTVAQIKLVSCQSTFTGKIQQLRQTLSERLVMLYPEKHAGVLRAMLLGEQQTLDDMTQEMFSTLGLVHVLSISGLHVSILVACLYFLLLICGCTRERAAVVILFFLPFYALLTGGNAPVIRSVVMAGMILLSVILRQTSDAVSFLALAFLTLLLNNPLQLWEPGFQLSFLLTFGLLYYVAPLSHHIPLPWHRLQQAIAAMVVSQVMSFPVIIAHFYQYAWLSGPINVVFSPIYSAVVLPGSTLSLLISYISLEWGSWLAQAITWLMEVLDRILTWIATLPNMTYSFSPPSLGWMICFFTVAWLFYAMVVTDRGSLRRFRYVAFAVLLGLIGMLVGRNGTSVTTITMIDVGQGDALLLETAGGKVILIDGGGTMPFPTKAWQQQRNTFEVGRNVVVPYLRYRGINHIDVMVMTHGDGDHIRGLSAVMERISVGEVWHSGAAPADVFEQKLLQRIQEKRIPIHMVQADVQFALEDGIKISMLHPPANVSRTNSNDSSIVMLLQLYRTNMLLTGDMEQPAEQEVINKYKLQPVQVLKVAHHGSKTSTTEEWLTVTKPQEALISVGSNNRYGHPHADVIERLRRIGAQIWRTDSHGAVTIYFNQNGYQIDSEVKR